MRMISPFVRLLDGSAGLRVVTGPPEGRTVVVDGGVVRTLQYGARIVSGASGNHHPVWRDVHDAVVDSGDRVNRHQRIQRRQTRLVTRIDLEEPRPRRWEPTALS
jgi:hypothetical protein